MLIKHTNIFGAHSATCAGCANAALYPASGTPLAYHDPTNESRQVGSSGVTLLHGAHAVMHHVECHGDDEPTPYALVDGDTVPVAIDGIWDAPSAHFATWTVR